MKAKCGDKILYFIVRSRYKKHKEDSSALTEEIRHTIHTQSGHSSLILNSLFYPLIIPCYFLLSESHKLAANKTINVELVKTRVKLN